MTSPLFFIMTLDLILRRYDSASPEKGISIADILIHLQGYADDVTVVDSGSEEGIQRLSTRVSSISIGSREDADMDLSTENTFSLHVQAQDPISANSPALISTVGSSSCRVLDSEFTSADANGKMNTRLSESWTTADSWLSENKKFDGKITPRTLIRGSPAPIYTLL